MSARTSEVTDHLVVLGDQVHDLHREVGEGGLKLLDPAPGDLREFAGRQLVDQFQVSVTDRFFDQASHQQLVLFT
jgi:hypothetical protein